MSNCKKPIKKPDFKDFCIDIDADKLYMTEGPVMYSGKWKEACKKNISGKDRGIFSKHERSWKKPKNVTQKKWNSMSAKIKGKFMKKMWEEKIKEYQICAAQESYKKGRKSLYQKLNKQPTPPPLPPSLSLADILDGRKLDDSHPPPFPTKLLPPPPPFPPTKLLPPPPFPTELRKTKSKKPKKPAKRKTEELYLNVSAKFSPKTAETWGVPLPQTPNDSPDNWGEHAPNKRTPLNLPKGLSKALQRAVGKGSRKKRKRRKNSTQKAKKKKTQKGKKKKNKKKSKKSKK
tara:strand:- start:502 stop:1368 length:867 start_codon:yes stop_codon:yes gene_type:complete